MIDGEAGCGQAETKAIPYVAVSKGESEGFYGPCDPTSGRPMPVDRLPPPVLVIQDEWHLISGLLGTMVGLK